MRSASKQRQLDRSSRAATLRDVAQAANVSVASASRAMNGLSSITESTRARIIEAATQLKYVPNIAARSLATRRTDTIGVILPDLHGNFFSEIIRGIDLRARSHRLHLLLSNSHGDALEAASAIRSMRGRVDGLLVMSPHIDSEFLAENPLNGLPIVLINTRVQGASHPSLIVDNHAGAVAIVKHLAKSGGAVAYISGPPENLDSRERRRGYREALGGVEGLVLVGDFSEESGQRAGRALAEMAERPSAVFAANDMMAIGCMLALIEAGIRVPEDIAIAGFDDIPVARLVRPSLTTVGTNIAELGGRALERLIATIAKEGEAGNAPELVQPRLVVRQSSAWSEVAAQSDAGKIGRQKT